MADEIVGICNIPDAQGKYHPLIAIKGEQGEKGEKGDKGDGPSEELVRSIVSQEVANVVAEAPEDFDTLKEISDWITTHEDSAAAMNTAILQNASDIANMKTLITGTLTAGQTTIELTSPDITSTSIIDTPFFWTDGETEPICYETIKVENGKVTMTFAERDADLLIGIRVM